MASFRRSRSGPKDRYPLAALAVYGPNKTFATKLVVSVLARPGQHEPSAMRTWTTHEVDVRSDLVVAAEVAGFVQQHGAKQTSKRSRSSLTFAGPMQTVSSIRDRCISTSWMRSKQRLAAVNSKRRANDTRPSTT